MRTTAARPDRKKAMSWRTGDRFPDQPPWPARPCETPSMSYREYRLLIGAYDRAKGKAVSSYHARAAAEKKALLRQGAPSSPLVITKTAGPPALSDSGAHKRVAVIVSVEGTVAEAAVLLHATPAGGSEEAAKRAKRKKHNTELYHRARKRLTDEALQEYLVPRHDVVPAHLHWSSTCGRKERIAQLARELSGRSAASPAITATPTIAASHEGSDGDHGDYGDAMEELHAGQERSDVEAALDGMQPAGSTGDHGDYGDALESGGNEDDDQGEAERFVRAIFDQGPLEGDMAARAALLANVSIGVVARLAEMRDLSEYEVKRAIVVAQNRVRMRSMGIEPIVPCRPPVRATTRAKGKERAGAATAQVCDRPRLRSDGLATTATATLIEEEGRFTVIRDPVCRHTEGSHRTRCSPARTLRTHCQLAPALAGRGRPFGRLGPCVRSGGLGARGRFGAATHRADGRGPMVCKACGPQELRRGTAPPGALSLGSPRPAAGGLHSTNV